MIISQNASGAKVLIIDEVSICLPCDLAKGDAVCREIKQSADPFGGIQIVMVGDFFRITADREDGNGRKRAWYADRRNIGSFLYDSSVLAKAFGVR